MTPAGPPAGHLEPGFGPVADTFAASVDPAGPGAALAVVVEGRPVVDLWAGTRDDAGSPWREHTCCLVFSGTKGVTATAVLLLVERGLLDLSWPVARLWPEFAAGGKGAVLVRDVLAHTAGLPGISERLEPADLGRPERIDDLLARQRPITAVGVPTYHAMTFGWLVDALVRRTDGRSVAQVVAADIVRPLGLDLWIGVPDDVLDRVATLRVAADFEVAALAGNGQPDPRLRLVYGNPPLVDLDWGSASVLQAGIPSANGVTTARSMARLYGCLALGGAIDGHRLLESATVTAAAAELSAGPDPLSGRPLRFGAGFELAGTPSVLGPAADAFGHTGSGGSSHGAWPALRTGFSLVVSELRPEARDHRAGAVLAALHRVVSR